LVVVVGSGGRNLLHDAFGHRQTDPAPLPATPDTVYDLASLTKALVTSLLAMRAVAAGQLRLSDPLLDGEGPSIRQTLAHAGGFVAHRPFHERVAAEPPDRRRARVVALAAEEPRAYPAGTRSIYTDLGFILLGDRLERLLGARLDALAAPLFAALGLSTLRFGATASDRPVAPTQRSAARGRLIVGEVDDLNAWAMEGVAGHAGLFGDAADVAALAHALCAAWRDGAPALVPGPVLREFWTPAGVPGSTWRLGWDGPAPTGSLAGDRISRAAVGHLAFTGCSLWMDPEREAFVAMLSNRHHPHVSDDKRFRDLRRTVNDTALALAGY